MESYNVGKESIESKPKLLFKLTLMRHEEPFYKDVGHDLTDNGVRGAISTGKSLGITGQISKDDEVFFMHSPVPRAKGTLDFVAEGAGLVDRPTRSIDQLRKSDMPDFDAFMKRVEELGFDQERVAEDHYRNDMYENRPDIVEPHSHKRERLYRSLEYLIRWFEKHSTGDKTPHIIAVSHFEIITHIINDVFGIETFDRFNVPAFGEQVYIEAYQSAVNDTVLLKVKYNSRTKEVLFNRATRSIDVPK